MGFGIHDLSGHARRLRLEAATAEAFTQFEPAGVRALLLKGPSISRWLYAGADARPYVDSDLLVAPVHLDAAEKVLHSLGYRRYFDDRRMPGWWREHAGEWLRDRDGVVLDLHRTLPGVKVDPEVAWEVLSREPEPVRVASGEVLALSLPARALHIALHAAQHGAGSPPPIEDLSRALAIADEGIWQAAASVAAELDAGDSFAAGLQLLPAGSELARRLGLPSSVSPEAALRASSPPPLALGFEQLARARGIRRVEIVWRKLVPPAEFMRHWDPRAGESRGALLRAYLRRPLWLLYRAPRGLRAWYRARSS